MPIRFSPGRRRFWSRYESAVYHRILMQVVGITVVAAVFVAMVKVASGQPTAALAALTLAVASTGVSALVRAGRFDLANQSLTVCVLVTVTVIAALGRGMADPLALALPLVVIVGTVVGGRHLLLPTGVLTVVAMIVLVMLERAELLPNRNRPPGWGDLIIAVAMIATASVQVWILTRAMEQQFDALQAADDELRVAYDATLEGWAKALEHKDKETEGHCRRVTELSVRLAREMGLSDTVIAHVRRGALLHDIGKIAVPDSILNKPGPLTPEERAVMEHHPRVAKEMLEGIDFLRPALCIPYSHHERWDGSGYPCGLRGEEIPLPARLFAVVDQYEALSSDRPYRAAWPRERVVAYLNESAGTILDPAAVSAFLRVIDAEPLPTPNERPALAAAAD